MSGKRRVREGILRGTGTAAATACVLIGEREAPGTLAAILTAAGTCLFLLVIWRSQ